MKTLLSRGLFACWCFFVLGLLPGQAEISEAELEKHLRFLASDELRGRRTGEPGCEAAARYIAEFFRWTGLKPLPGLDGYLQRLPLRSLTPARSGRLSIDGKAYALNEGLLVLEGPSLQSEKTPLALLESTPEQASLEGRIAVAAFGAEGSLSLREARGASQAKLRAAREKGALALLEVIKAPPSGRLSRILAGRPSMASEAEGQATPIPHWVLFEESDLLERVRLGATAQVDVDGRRLELLPASNVVGLVEGTDPDFREEYVILMAHFDHIGAGPDLPGATPEDDIFNGARDNGFGTVALMAAARILSQSPPRRSVIFLAATGEEMGLLGSRYYAENPPLPLRQTVFGLNVDTAGFTDTDIVTVVGLERTTARRDLQEACAEVGLEAIPDPAPAEGLFNRSDNASFARKGIPSLTFSPGFREWNQELVRHYHRPSDEVHSDFDFAYLLRFSKAFAAAARRVAENPERPAWVAGDPFEEAWRQLNGR